MVDPRLFVLFQEEGDGVNVERRACAGVKAGAM